jgi:hypothetical protein
MVVVLVVVVVLDLLMMMTVIVFGASRGHSLDLLSWCGPPT